MPSSLPKTPHTAPKLLMCPPKYYNIDYEINPWMSLKRKVNNSRAQQQWRHLYEVLTEDLGVRISLLKPKTGVPDLVFTANAGLVLDRKIIRSNFRHPERQLEEPIIERHFKQRGYEIIRLSSRFNFEGEGDALWLNNTLILGFKFRSDSQAHIEISNLIQKRVLAVELTDKRFYHLDTCFCPLGNNSALWFPKAFDRYGQRVIENNVEDLISVSEADAKRFACNAIVLNKAMVLQKGCSERLKRAVQRKGFRCFPVDLSEFHKAGGSAKCLVLKLN